MGFSRRRGLGNLRPGRADHRDRGINGHDRAIGVQHLQQRPRHRRSDLGGDLVGLDLEQGLELAHSIADLLQPAADLAFNHALAELGHADGCCHLIR